MAPRDERGRHPGRARRPQREGRPSSASAAVQAGCRSSACRPARASGRSAPKRWPSTTARQSKQTPIMGRGHRARAGDRRGPRPRVRLPQQHGGDGLAGCGRRGDAVDEHGVRSSGPDQAACETSRRAVVKGLKAPPAARRRGWRRRARSRGTLRVSRRNGRARRRRPGARRLHVDRVAVRCHDPQAGPLPHHPAGGQRRTVAGCLGADLAPDLGGGGRHPDMLFRPPEHDRAVGRWRSPLAGNGRNGSHRSVTRIWPRSRMQGDVEPDLAGERTVPSPAARAILGASNAPAAGIDTEARPGPKWMALTRAPLTTAAASAWTPCCIADNRRSGLQQPSLRP